MITRRVEERARTPAAMAELPAFVYELISLHDSRGIVCLEIFQKAYKEYCKLSERDDVLRRRLQAFRAEL